MLSADGLAEVQEILQATGALAEVEERISVNRDLALAVLDRGVIATAAADALHSIALAATDRSA